MLSLEVRHVTGADKAGSDTVTHNGKGDRNIFGHIRIRHARRIGLWLMERVTEAFRTEIDAVTKNGECNGCR